MLIALASKDGVSINQHFGHAERFLIFEVEGDEVRLVAEKQVERYCSFDPDHPLRGHILRDIAATLDGCRVIVCAQIGEAPRMELERLGIDCFVVEGPIAPTLIALSKML